MRARLFAILALLLLFPTVAFEQNKDDQSKDKSYIQQAEADWAASLVSNDVKVLDRIMADDFVGVDIDASQYTKADAIKDFSTHPSNFESNKVDGVEVRIYGDAAVAQGSENWKKKDGTAGQFVWTDTWVRRDGQWKVVAAEDIVAPPASEKQ